MQREDVLQGLGLAAVQVWRTIVDAEQRGNIEPIRSQGNRSRSVVWISIGSLGSKVPTFSR